MHNNISGDSSLFGGLFFFYIEEEITRVKKLTNMTTHSFDLERFGNNAGLKEFLRRHSLDGLELMEIGEDEKQILQKEDVVGFHRLHYPCWYCFWKKDIWKGPLSRR